MEVRIFAMVGLAVSREDPASRSIVGVHLLASRPVNSMLEDTKMGFSLWYGKVRLAQLSSLAFQTYVS